jgi:hypothetical protein
MTRLIDVTLTVEIEDDTDWEAAADQVVAAVEDGAGRLVLSIAGRSVGDEWTQL